jgi:hypothetical protein
MRRRLVSLALLLLPTIAWAQGSYSIITSAALDAALTSVVTDINANRAAQTPPLGAITNQQYLQSLVNQHAQQWRIQRAREAVESVGTWGNMTASQKTRFCTAVGLSPCPP